MAGNADCGPRAVVLIITIATGAFVASVVLQGVAGSALRPMLGPVLLTAAVVTRPIASRTRSSAQDQSTVGLGGPMAGRAGAVLDLSGPALVGFASSSIAGWLFLGLRVQLIAPHARGSAR